MNFGAMEVRGWLQVSLVVDHGIQILEGEQWGCGEEVMAARGG